MKPLPVIEAQKIARRTMAARFFSLYTYSQMFSPHWAAYKSFSSDEAGMTKMLGFCAVNLAISLRARGRIKLIIGRARQEGAGGVYSLNDCEPLARLLL